MIKSDYFISRILFYSLSILLIYYCYLKFSIRGYHGAELYGYGKLLLITNSLISIYLIMNFRMVVKLEPIAFLTILWMTWVVITCFVNFEIGSQDFIFSILEVTYCPLIFLFFFFITKSYPIMFEKSKFIYFLLFLIGTSLYLSIFKYQNLNTANNLASLNDVYYLLLLLPWILILDNKYVRYIGVVFIFIAVVYSMKRTAIISMNISMIIYYFLERFTSRKKINIKIITYLAVTLCLFYLIFNFVNTNTGGYLGSRFSDFGEDQGSGRILIYKRVIDLQLSGTIDDWFLGNGHNNVRRYLSIRKINNLSAHNDFLEVLFDYGLPGIFMYLLLHIYLIIMCLKLIKERSLLGPPMAVSYSLFLFISLTSHLIIYASYFSYLMAFWGSIYAIYNNNRISDKYLTN